MKYGRFRQDIRTVSLKMQCLSPELKSAQNGQSGSSNTSRPCSNRSAVSGPVFAKYIFSPTCHPLSTCGPQNCCCLSQEISTLLNSSTAEHMLFFFYLSICTCVSFITMNVYKDISLSLYFSCTYIEDISLKVST